MIYVAEGINLQRMADDQEFTHYRLAHIIDCLENGKDFTAVECGKMLAEVQTAKHKEEKFKDWLYDTLKDRFMAFSESDKERMLDGKDHCVRTFFFPQEGA